MIRLITVLIFSLSFLADASCAFLYTTKSGLMGPGGTTNLFSTTASGIGTIDGDAATANDIIVIQSNHTITLTDNITCRSLRVETNGKLLGGTPASGDWNSVLIKSALNITSNVVINGTVGNGIPSTPGNQDRIGFSLQGLVTMSGTGTVTIHRLVTLGIASTINIDMDMTVYNYVSTWGPAFYAQTSTTNSTLNINNGKTVTIYGFVSLDGETGINGIQYLGDINVHGKLEIIQGGIYIKSDNSGTGVSTLYVRPTGELILNNNPIIGTGAVNDPNPANGVALARIINEGILRLSRSEPMIYGILARSYIQNNTGSAVHYDGGFQMIKDPIRWGKFYDLYIEGSSIALLNRDIEVENNLYLYKSLSISNYDLTLSKNHTGFSSSAFKFNSYDNFIITGGTGVVKFIIPANNITSPIQIPVSNGNTSALHVENNSGISDQLSLRVTNSVLDDGTTGNTVSTHVVKKTWHISEQTPGGQNARLSFYWANADMLTQFDALNCYVTRHDGNNWDSQSGGFSGPGVFSNSLGLSRNNINSFGTFAVTSTLILPVELIDFKVKANHQKVDLLWSTASEINNDYFEIEHSTDGVSFEKIGIVDGKGNTTNIQHYRFQHAQPKAGFNYYRLNQVDFDGKNKKSKIASVLLKDKDSSIELRPNIVNQTSTLYLQKTFEKDIEIEIIALSGNRVKSFSLPKNQNFIELDLDDLPNSTYLLKLETGEHLRFVKQ